jgi:hypothetical protein
MKKAQLELIKVYGNYEGEGCICAKFVAKFLGGDLPDKIRISTSPIPLKGYRQIYIIPHPAVEFIWKFSKKQSYFSYFWSSAIRYLRKNGINPKGERVYVKVEKCD